MLTNKAFRSRTSVNFWYIYCIFYHLASSWGFYLWALKFNSETAYYWFSVTQQKNNVNLSIIHKKAKNSEVRSCDNKARRYGFKSSQWPDSFVIWFKLNSPISNCVPDYTSVQTDTLYTSLDSEDDFRAEFVETSVTNIENSLSQDYTNTDDLTTWSSAAPGLKPFTVLY